MLNYEEEERYMRFYELEIWREWIREQYYGLF